MESAYDRVCTKVKQDDEAGYNKMFYSNPLTGLLERSRKNCIKRSHRAENNMAE
jgi:hypothetical protein